MHLHLLYKSAVFLAESVVMSCMREVEDDDIEFHGHQDGVLVHVIDINFMQNQAPCFLQVLQVRSTAPMLMP